MRLTRRLLAGFLGVIMLSLGCDLLVPTSLGAQSPDESGDPLGREMSAAEQALRSSETQIAESHYRQALLEAWMMLGALAVVDGDLERAGEAFERASTRALEIRRPMLALAGVQMRRGEADAAVTLLRRLVGRRPDDLGVRRLLARAMFAAGSAAEAVQELEETRVLAPDDPELAFTLATGKLRLGRIDEAAALFDEVLAARPGAETHVLLGRTYRDFERYDLARRELERALEIDPKVPRAHLYLGTVVLLEQGRGSLEPSMQEFRRELESSPDDPLTHQFLGLALVEERRFEESLPHLDIAAAHPTSRLVGLQFRGRALLALGRPEEAVASLRAALEVPSFATAEPQQRVSLHYQLARALRQIGEADEAQIHFDAAELETEGLTRTSRERLRRYLADEQNESAGPSPVNAPIDTLGVERLAPEERAALRRHAEEQIARAQLNLGVLHARAGRHDRAASAFAAGVAVSPDFPRLQYSLGVALFNAGRFEDAVEPLERAAASPETAGDPALRRMRAMAHLETGGWQSAAELLADDPERATNPSLQFAYGTSLVRSGRADEALDVFGRMEGQAGASAELAALVGEAKAAEGDWNGAVADLRRALELDPKVRGAHQTLGEIHLRKGELEDAERELRAELGLDQDTLRSRYLLATVLDLADRPVEAEAAARRVLAASPEHGGARYLLGKILLGEGDAEGAATQLEAAARLLPEDSNVRYQLAQAYQRLGERDLARQSFDLYRELKAAERDAPSGEGSE